MPSCSFIIHLFFLFFIVFLFLLYHFITRSGGIRNCPFFPLLSVQAPEQEDPALCTFMSRQDYLFMEFPFLIGQSGRGYQKMSLLIYCMKSGGESWDTGQTICKNDYCWNMEIFNATKNNAYSSFNNCNFKIGLI